MSIEKSKVLIKVLAVAFAFYIIIYSLILFSCTRNNSSNNTSDYEAYLQTARGAEVYMPKLEDIGEYKKIVINHKRTEYLLWELNAVSLEIQYDEAEFYSQLERINEKYMFLEESTNNLNDVDATVQGYNVRIAEMQYNPNDEYFYYYPKCFMMIGVNEDEYSIVFMYHYDVDLDEIEDLDKFIKKYYVLNLE